MDIIETNPEWHCLSCKSDIVLSVERNRLTLVTTFVALTAKSPARNSSNKSPRIDYSQLKYSKLLKRNKKPSARLLNRMRQQVDVK